LRVPALWHGYTVCVGIGCLLLVCGLPWAMQIGVLAR